MANRLSFSGEQWWNAVSRNAFAGAKMYTYTAQSRTVNKTTWTDASEATPHANPIIADANGIFPEIYGSGVYFIDIYSSDDATLIYQADDIYPTASASGSVQLVVANLIADLKAIDTTSFQYAKTLGSTVIDDGGQAEYYYSSGSTATPNDTTVVQPDVGTGRWLILNTETLAIGDNSVTESKLGFSPVTRYFYTASGTHTPQAETSRIEFEVIGAGGGGGGTNLAVANTLGGGGGGGGYVFSSTDTIAASYTVTVGSGGTGGAAGLNNGSSGGNSIVTDGASYTLTSTGGSGGVAGTNGNTGANGAYGVGTGGDILANGSTSVSVSAGGTSVFNGEVLPVDDSDGEDAITVGCGGNGGRNTAGGGTNFAGGDGFDGWIRVTEYH